jgi:2-oxo-4-hydroxy-4-carboxy-5-ureidoimidazoline decarboxylase
VTTDRPATFVLDALDDAAFVAAVGPWFEGAPRFLARLAAARPFGSEHELFARAKAIAMSMPEAEQIELLDAHPRLGAPPSGLSAASFHEQGYDRDAAAALAAEIAAERARVADELQRLNEAYEARHGFRYCVFVAGRSREALLPGLGASLAADRSSELARGLGDVIAIARDRAAADAAAGLASGGGDR